MAAICGIYRDKGRSLTLLTSIVKDNIRVRDHAVATSISLNPNNAEFADVGEWVQKGAASVSRPTVVLATPEVAGIVHAAGGSSAPEMPKLVWSERGGTDVQAAEKMPIIEGGGSVEGTFGMWIAEAAQGISVGDRLGVVYIQGDDTVDGTLLTTLSNYTGTKGILYAIGTGVVGGTALILDDLGIAAADKVWCVGVATGAATANAGTLQAEIYSTPYLVTIT